MRIISCMHFILLYCLQIIQKFTLIKAFHVSRSSYELTEEQKDKILLEVLSNGKGSLDYAKNLVAFCDLQPPDPPQTKPPWCTCGVCRPMPTEEENRCCKKIRCVTSFVTFQNTCTDRDVFIRDVFIYPRQ